ncbi:hypothetical protein RRX38_13010 [Pseudomonas sp. DTU_2021_1001937_2_SI_NGA_ILE_001]|uniref:hypothetical protein n=1 Tax=Pseudomonas sp. DTU_2021_1001937_2_SI_NGA_ILE_001 TaxID=3077589 RepID=UPI0025E880F1|nr:hypothetical protein [Pseudomonas sp. DTU_2021_1001937_2_SI_NGA_ILE_001]WNW12025.1 hypothetical protein RRX38_13010 [Pseudomonas sp. DTU_2021_1001937_2_SI_NGA_ILE_001]
MGLILAVLVFLTLVGLALYLFDKGARTRWLQPHIGLLLIGLLLAGMAWLAGLISVEAESWLMLAAKLVIAVAGILLGLRLIKRVAKRFIFRN